MREIKFRAWHTGGKYPEDAQMIYDKPHHVLKWLDEGQPVTVMQFTGLKDKNGVEIYEGDIVSDELIGICQVKFNDIHAAFKVVHKNGRTAKWFVDYLPKEFKYLKVIGNKYENPELLE